MISESKKILNSLVLLVCIGALKYQPLKAAPYAELDKEKTSPTKRSLLGRQIDKAASFAQQPDETTDFFETGDISVDAQLRADPKNPIPILSTHFTNLLEMNELLKALLLLENIDLHIRFPEVDSRTSDEKNKFFIESPENVEAKLESTAVRLDIQQIGAILKATNKEGNNFLHFVAANKHKKIWEKLTNPSEEYFYRFLARLIDLEPEVLTTPNNEGYLPLHMAAKEGKAEFAIMLLRSGADPLAVSNYEEFNFIQLATSFDQKEFIDFIKLDRSIANILLNFDFQASCKLKTVSISSCGDSTRRGSTESSSSARERNSFKPFRRSIEEEHPEMDDELASNRSLDESEADVDNLQFGFDDFDDG